MNSFLQFLSFTIFIIAAGPCFLEAGSPDLLVKSHVSADVQAAKKYLPPIQVTAPSGEKPKVRLSCTWLRRIPRPLGDAEGVADGSTLTWTIGSREGNYERALEGDAEVLFQIHERGYEHVAIRRKMSDRSPLKIELVELSTKNSWQLTGTLTVRSWGAKEKSIPLPVELVYVPAMLARSVAFPVLAKTEQTIGPVRIAPAAIQVHAEDEPSCLVLFDELLLGRAVAASLRAIGHTERSDVKLIGKIRYEGKIPVEGLVQPKSKKAEAVLSVEDIVVKFAGETKPLAELLRKKEFRAAYLKFFDDHAKSSAKKD